MVKNLHRTLILVMGLTLLMLVAGIIYLQRSRRLNGVRTQEIRMQNQMENFVGLHLQTLAYERHEEVPTDSRELCVWMEERIKHSTPNYLEDLPSGTLLYGIWDIEKRELIDDWGNPIHIIETDGIFAGIGSAGINGRWEGGQNDDIVVLMRQ